MPKVGSILEILRTERVTVIDWCIDGFPTTHFRRGWWLESPVFSFVEMEWRLYFRKHDKSSGSSVVVLMPRKYSGKSHFSAQVNYWLGVRRAEGGLEKIGSGRVIHDYQLDCELQPPLNYQSHHECRSRHYYFWLPFQELERRIESLAPSGTLKFIINLQKGLETGNEMSSVNTRKEPSSTEARIHTGIDDTHFLTEHYRNLLLHADDHDVVIKVKGTEFKAHKNVLRVRSPVFQGMFKHNMKENMEDTVIIEDIDPDCFGDFLMYVYTGKLENIPAANAIGLYYAADKYDFPALKTGCVDVLKASLSNSMVCDILAMAIAHEEEELLESGMAYVTCHLEELMETPNWQQFLLSNPLQANEISLKALKRRRTSSLQK